MGSLGTGELLIILAIVLLVFGGAKLPKLARSLGQAQREFKKGVVEEDASTDPPEETSTGSSEETSTGDSA